MKTENFFVTLGGILTGALIMFVVLLWATSAENWYAGMHDQNCETLVNSVENCNCYERFLEAEKKGIK